MLDFNDSRQFRKLEAYPGYGVGSVWSRWKRGGRGVVCDEWRQLKPYHNIKTGYLYVSFHMGERQRSRSIHRVVLAAFKGEGNPGDDCCHFDGNRHNNAIENLRWATRTENKADELRHGTRNSGSRHGNAKLNEVDVQKIRKMASEGVDLTAMAKDFSVCCASVRLIVLRKTWKHVA